MFGFSIWHWLALAAIVLLVVGSGRIPTIMADIAKGFRAFRSNLKDEQVEKRKDPPA